MYLLIFGIINDYSVINKEYFDKCIFLYLEGGKKIGLTSTMHTKTTMRH